MRFPKSKIENKDNKLQVPIEYIEWLDQERRKINTIKLEDIEFFKDGKKLNIPEKRVHRFKLIGLSNIEFILSNFYDENDNDEFWEGLVTVG